MTVKTYHDISIELRDELLAVTAEIERLRNGLWNIIKIANDSDLTPVWALNEIVRAARWELGEREEDDKV